MEKLGLGPELLMQKNPRLIYARLTGWGQSGAHAHKAGHDLNYIAVSGLLSLFGRKNEKPTAPVNFAADLAGGSLVCAFGVVAALFERSKSGKGQVIDSAMVDGSAYIGGSWLYRSVELPFKVCDPDNRGVNMLDTGYHFYDTYETKDGKFMSVGALEPQFYAALLKVMPIGESSDQLDDNEAKTRKLTELFKTKTRDEWAKVFENVDACVFPVLTPTEAAQYRHNTERRAFSGDIPNPAPKLSRTPGTLARDSQRNEMDEVVEILREIGVPDKDFKELYENDVILLENTPKL